jgi:hypothetical protein
MAIEIGDSRLRQGDPLRERCGVTGYGLYAPSGSHSRRWPSASNASTAGTSEARSSNGVTRQCRASHAQVTSFAASSAPTMTMTGIAAAAKIAVMPKKPETPARGNGRDKRGGRRAPVQTFDQAEELL